MGCLAGTLRRMAGRAWVYEIIPLSGRLALFLETRRRKIGTAASRASTWSGTETERIPF
jgi:hypothetical protein